MQEAIQRRVLKESEYIVEHKATVRRTAKEFLVSKSTVHKDVTERIYLLDKELFKKVQAVLIENLSERHIRGGNATKEKYERLKKSVPLSRNRID